MARKRWSREELILAFDLYCRIPFGRIHIRNPEVIALAAVLGRTVSAVSWKLANLASLDPSLKSRKIKGASHGSTADGLIWEEFCERGEALVVEAQQIRDAYHIASPVPPESSAPPKERAGLDKETLAKMRIGQSFFRGAVLASYNWTCCVTGLNHPALLTASHITPWATDHKNRVNPSNGLCLNALHDRAFDRYLMTVSPEFRVVLADDVRKRSDAPFVDLLLKYDGAPVLQPKRFRPDPALLDRHRCEFARRSEGKRPHRDVAELQWDFNDA